LGGIFFPTLMFQVGLDVVAEGLYGILFTQRPVVLEFGTYEFDCIFLRLELEGFDEHAAMVVCYVRQSQA
jgi:hypothetical protein